MNSIGRRNTTRLGCYAHASIVDVLEPAKRAVAALAAGESLTDIASALQRDHSRIDHVVEAEGGIAPLRGAVPPGRNTDRARRNLSRSRARRVGAWPGAAAAARGLDHQPGDTPAWRPITVPGAARRPPRVGARAAPEGVSLGHASRIAARRRRETDPAVVAAADRRLASGSLSERS